MKLKPNLWRTALKRSQDWQYNYIIYRNVSLIWDRQCHSLTGKIKKSQRLFALQGDAGRMQNAVSVLVATNVWSFKAKIKCFRNNIFPFPMEYD